MRQCRGDQQRNVADVIAADGHGDQALGAVQRGDLGWCAVSPLAEHVLGGRPGEGDVHQVVLVSLRNQMCVVACGSARPARGPGRAGPDAGTGGHRTTQRHIATHGRGLDACAQNRFGIRPARRARYPAVTAAAIAAAIAAGSAALVTAVANSTASQPNSIARAASLAVPMPASSTTGTPARATIISMLCGLVMPRPVPIGEPSGMTAAQPASSSRRASTGSSLV